MRIAYVCLDAGVPVFGRKGSSIHCQEIIRAFAQRGYDVELFALRLGDDVQDDLQPIKVHHFGGKIDNDPARREQALLGMNPMVQQALEHAQPFDLVYERYSLWNCAAMRFANANGIPGILEVNSPLIQEQAAYRTLIDESAAKSIRALCFRNATSIVAVSDQITQDVRKNYHARNKTTTIPNGVNCEKFDSITGRAQDSSTELTIGFLGTLKPWHGVATLLDAYADVRSQNPNVKLKIIGDGPERQKLEERLKRFAGDVQHSVQWLGAIPNRAVPEVLQTFDIAVAPYPELPDFYFSPLKILEYMAAGLPVIASRIGQIPSLIENNVTGLLVKPGCRQTLADSLLQMSFERELRQRLGDAAGNKARTDYTWIKVVDRMLATIPLPWLHSETV